MNRTIDLDVPLAQVTARLEGSTPADARRLFHGRGGCHPGFEDLVIDRYGTTLRAGLHGPRDGAWVDALGAGLAGVAAQHGMDGAWLQQRDATTAPTRVLFGTPAARTVVREAGLQFDVHPGDHRNAGLFLDAAPVRAWLREEARGARVLNLFAYTCALSVAALAGGARGVINVDMARGALRIGEGNHRANGLRGARFLPHDVFASWGRLRRLGPYDLVILDPPMRQPGSFEAERDWPKLLRRLESLLAPGGRVLTLLNSPFLDRAALGRWMTQEAPALTELGGAPSASPDFDEIDAQRGLKIGLWGRAALSAAIGAGISPAPA